MKYLWLSMAHEQISLRTPNLPNARTHTPKIRYTCQPLVLAQHEQSTLWVELNWGLTVKHSKPCSSCRSLSNPTAQLDTLPTFFCDGTRPGTSRKLPGFLVPMISSPCVSSSVEQNQEIKMRYRCGIV